MAWSKLDICVLGGVHGGYQIIGDELRPLKQKINKRIGTKTKAASYKFGQVIINFILVTFAWIFFRAPSIHDAFIFIGRIFTRVNLWAFSDGTLYELGLDVLEMHILIVALVILLVIDWVRYKYNLQIDDFLNLQNIWFRWGVIFLLFWMILIFGEYGLTVDPQGFIYFQF